MTKYTGCPCVLPNRQFQKWPIAMSKGCPHEATASQQCSPLVPSFESGLPMGTTTKEKFPHMPPWTTTIKSHIVMEPVKSLDTPSSNNITNTCNNILPNPKHYSSHRHHLRLAYPAQNNTRMPPTTDSQTPQITPAPFTQGYQ